MIVSAEAEAIGQSFEMRDRGESQGYIAGWINSRGFRTGTGQMFTGYSIRDMPANRFYVGVISYQDEEYPGKHRAIIPESPYQQVQLRRHKHSRKNIRGGNTGALQGMLFCRSCGNPIHSERNHQGDPRYRERHGWPCDTNGRSVISHRIYPQIGEVIAGIKLPPEWRELILKGAILGGSAMDLSALKKQRQRVARAYGDGAYSDEDCQRRLDKIDARIFSNIPVLMPSIEEAADLLDDLPGMWREALLEERRRLVAPLIERVCLDLKVKKIAAIKPRPEFGEILAHATRDTGNPNALLLSPDETQGFLYVGLVETGEGRTRYWLLFAQGI